MTKLSEKLLKLGNRAIKKAQENNRKKGIPNVYCINGKIIFELPNGEEPSSRHCSPFQCDTPKIRSRRFAPYHEFFSDKLKLL